MAVINSGFTKSSEVDEAFVSNILQDCTESNGKFYLDINGVQFLVRFSNKSGYVPTQDNMKEYPVIVISFLPVRENPKYKIYVKNYIEEFYNSTDDTVAKVYLPLRRIHTYQLSVTTTSISHKYLAEDWLNTKFDTVSVGASFIFNPLETPENGVLGIFCPYKTQFSEEVLPDKKFQYNLTVTMEADTHIKPSVISDAVSKLKIRAAVTDSDVSIVANHIFEEIN